MPGLLAVAAKPGLDLKKILVQLLPAGQRLV
jgi:hypothetical protein